MTDHIDKVAEAIKKTISVEADIIAVPNVKFVRPHFDVDQRIAGRATVEAGIALAAQA
mgnify:CR=1 FL=1